MSTAGLPRYRNSIARSLKLKGTTMQNEIEFTWIGINPAGKKISGNLFSYNKKTAYEKLLSEKITILAIAKKQQWITFTRSMRFSHQHRLDFTQQLQLLLQASLPLSDALTLIADHSQYKLLAKSQPKSMQK